MKQRKLHYHYVGPTMSWATLCRPTLGGERIQSTMDPAQVTCQACLSKMATVTRDPERRENNPYQWGWWDC